MLDVTAGATPIPGDFLKITGHIATLRIASVDKMVVGDSFSSVLAGRNCLVHFENIVFAARPSGRCRFRIGTTRVGCLRSEGNLLATVVECQFNTRRRLILIVHVANFDETHGVNLREVRLKGKVKVMAKNHFYSMIANFTSVGIADDSVKLFRWV